MALDKLPKELLLMTTAYLPARDLEALALTLNKSITLTCLPNLLPLFSRRRRDKDMIGCLGLYSYSMTEAERLERLRDELGIPSDARLVNGDQTGAPPMLEYLHLKGDLHWLGPLDESTDREMDPHKNHTSGGLQEVIGQAQKAGIALPPAFVKLFKSQELMDRIPSTSACYLEISGGLRKCPAKVDNGAGGYLARFYSDQQGCGYWLLYIQPGEEGKHAVLSSAIDLNVDEEYGEDEVDWNGVDATREEVNEAKKEGWKMAMVDKGDVWLEGLDFEEWLAKKYFDEWLSFALYDDVDWNDESAERLREYVREVYVKN